MNRSAVVVSTIPLNCVEAFLVTLSYTSFRKLSVAAWCEMVKLVGILGDGGGGGARACLARRQIPLEIEADLTMVIIKLYYIAVNTGFKYLTSEPQQHQRHKND